MHRSAKSMELKSDPLMLPSMIVPSVVVSTYSLIPPRLSIEVNLGFRPQANQKLDEVMISKQCRSD
jgi:hypothetical protein